MISGDLTCLEVTSFDRKSPGSGCGRPSYSCKITFFTPFLVIRVRIWISLVGYYVSFAFCINYYRYINKKNKHTWKFGWMLGALSYNFPHAKMVWERDCSVKVACTSLMAREKINGELLNFSRHCTQLGLLAILETCPNARNMLLKKGISRMPYIL